MDYGGLTATTQTWSRARRGSPRCRCGSTIPTTAVDWLTQAAASSPNDVRLLASLADAQIRAGDTTGAHTTIAHGLEREPKNPVLASLARRANQIRNLKFGILANSEFQILNSSSECRGASSISSAPAA